MRGLFFGLFDMLVLVVWFYTVIAFWIALYGANAVVLTLLFWYRRRGSSTSSSARGPQQWPHVTVQLPIYNERHVVGRLIDAVARLDYPREKLEIQVLDDSTDETRRIVDRLALRWRQRGVDVRVLRRPERTEYKAGALKYGLRRARGTLVAVFDADFVPPRNWLRRTVPILTATPELGLVQTRWGHINAEYSALTRAQALALDGHFAIEQSARAENNLFLNFNGTAGLWRRRCIEEAGGWRGTTLSEDLDLSYRAQLRGWRLAYRSDIVAPAEIPVQMAAFKRQQFRWAKGSIQCARLLGRPVLQSSTSWWVKLQALLHLTGYLVHLGMVFLLLTTLPLLLADWPVQAGIPPGWLGFASLGAPLLYVVAQRALYDDWRQRACWLPALMLVGIGIAVSNTRAVLEGLFQQGGAFRRTPKFGVEQKGEAWRERSYRLDADWAMWGEFVLALYAGITTVVAALQHRWFTIPFLLLYTVGFLFVGGLTWWQGRTPRKQGSTSPQRQREQLYDGAH